MNTINANVSALLSLAKFVLTEPIKRKVTFFYIYLIGKISTT